MKKLRFLGIALMATLLSVGIASCGGSNDDPINNVTPTPTPSNTTVKVESVAVSSATVSLTEGDSQTITVTISPSNATDKKYTFSSSDTSIVTIDENGKITAVKAGEATITVTTSDGNKTATCKVTVKVKEIPVESVSLDKTELSLTEEQTETLTATVYPDNATNTEVTWTSSDPSIANVDENGKITALKAGEITITVTSSDGNKTATCKVAIAAKKIAVESITAKRTSLTFDAGIKSHLNALINVNPDNAEDVKIIWVSSNDNIVKIDGEWYICVGAGTATLTAQVEGTSLKASIEIIVEDDIIVFADANAKKRCLRWDKNKDGELSMNEARSVTNINFSSKGEINVGLKNYVDERADKSFNYFGNVTVFTRYFNNSYNDMTMKEFNEFRYFTSVYELPSFTFYMQTEMKSVTLPNSLTKIGKWAFRSCISLESITIPQNVKTIGHRIFENCKNLKSITILAEEPPTIESMAELLLGEDWIIEEGRRWKNEDTLNWNANDFDKNHGFRVENCTIYVPKGSVQKYKKADGWSKYADYIKAIEK
jgi:uncharacterized protein YjdB